MDIKTFKILIKTQYRKEYFDFFADVIKSDRDFFHGMAIIGYDGSKKQQGCMDIEISFRGDIQILKLGLELGKYEKKKNIKMFVAEVFTELNDM